MATTSRAYGARGAMIALATTALAAAVQGVLTALTSVIALETALAAVACIALAMAGATSARRSRAGALTMAVAMAALFFWLRWTVWQAMSFGPEAALGFALTPPWGWPAAMAALAAGGELSGNVLWVVEALATLTAAAAGTLIGHEPPG